jgi:hypothetical protein
MAVTDAANALALAAVIDATLDSISVISVHDADGEFFRKTPTEAEEITATKKQFTFWLNENEGSGNIIKLSLYGNGATVTLGTGTELITQIVDITKVENKDSLTVIWTVEVIE